MIFSIAGIPYLPYVLAVALPLSMKNVLVNGKIQTRKPLIIASCVWVSVILTAGTYGQLVHGEFLIGILNGFMKSAVHIFTDQLSVSTQIHDIIFILATTIVPIVIVKKLLGDIKSKLKNISNNVKDMI